MTTSPAQTAHHGRPRVVIIGSGFGGLFAAQRLKKAPVDVPLIGKTSPHLCQPLLYQVATGILSEGEIAPATREILKRHENTRVVLGEVTDIDLTNRTVTSTVLGRTMVHPYDELIVAAGAGQSYFGNDQFAEFAPGMKSIDDALELRGRIFGAFELAEIEQEPEQRKRLMTFVVVGAGPTGVEMAGQIAEMARRTLRREFRTIDPREARILLIEGSDRVVGTFSRRLSASAQRALERLGVSVLLTRRVLEVDEGSVTVEDAEGTLETIPAGPIVWAAGVHASPLARLLADGSDGSLDRAGRLEVQPDLTLPGHPEVFAIGDMVTIRHP